MPQTVAMGQITLIDLNDAKSLSLSISPSLITTQLFDQNAGTYTPSWASTPMVFTPVLNVVGSATNIIGEATVVWKEDGTAITAGGAYAINATTKALTVSANQMTGKSYVKYTCEISWTDATTGNVITASNDRECIKVVTGENSYTVVMTNESHSVIADSAGTVKANELGASGRAKSTVNVYKGSVALTGVTGTPTTGQFKLVAGTMTNVTATLGANSVQIDTLTADSGTAMITVQLEGTAKTVTKTMSLTKVRDGVTGAPATAYMLVIDAPTITKSITGVYSPTQFTASATQKTGTAAPAAYSGRYKISTTTNLAVASPTWTVAYTSTADEASKAYTIPASIAGIKVELYQAGGTTTLLDTEIVTIVSDGATGATGANAINLSVWAPDGTVILNDTNTLTVQADIYSGSTLLTSGVTYKWYNQETNGTWTLITGTPVGLTNFTTKKMTVAPSAFENVETYKCVATYGGKDYEGTVTLIDKTDSFQVEMQGINTFRNGEGSTTIRARLYQNGVVVDDASPYTYTYTWYLKDADGNALNFTPSGSAAYASKTGKSVTVTADEVPARSNLMVEISK